MDDLFQAWDDITLASLPMGCEECGAKLPAHSPDCSSCTPEDRKRILARMKEEQRYYE